MNAYTQCDACTSRASNELVLLSPDGSVDERGVYCLRHALALGAVLIPAYTDGRPAYRWEPLPQPVEVTR